MSANWTERTDFDSVCRRAAGRRRYNVKRRAEARERYKLVVQAIVPPDGRRRGWQTRLARALGVHRSTICRDVAKWRQFMLKVMRRYRSLMGERENALDTDEVKLDLTDSGIRSIHV